MRPLSFILVLGAFTFLSGTARAENYEQCVERAIRTKSWGDAITCLRTAESNEPKSYRIAFLLGDVFLRSGQPDSAIVHLRRAVELKDDYIEGYQQLGAACVAAKQYGAAIDAYEHALKNERRDPSFTSTYGLGHAYAMADSFKPATLWLSKAVDLDKSKLDPYLELGDLYVRSRVYILAKEQYELALGLQPKSQSVHRKLAQVHEKSGAYDSAVAEYNVLLSIDSTDKEALIALADIYVLAKRWANAREVYHRLSVLDPSNMTSRMNEGTTAFRAKMFAEAIEPLEAVSKATVPDSVRIADLRFLAESYFLHKDRKLASGAYDKLIALDSSVMTAEDFRWYAGSLLEVGDTAKAFHELEIFTLRDSTDCDICKLIGPRKMTEKNYPSAIFFFKLRLKRCDTTASTLKNIGLCYQVLEKPDSAILWYRMALAKKPYDGWATSHLVNIYYQKDDRDSVIALYSDFIAHVNPDSTPPNELGDAHKYIGLVRLQKKEYSSALESLKKAQTYLKEDCDVTLWIGQSHHNLQQKEEAIKVYKEVIARGCKNAKSAKDLLKVLEGQ